MRYFIKGLRNFLEDPAVQAVLGVASVVIATGTGTVFYRFVEDLRWIDCLYFSVITLTTVGYGDFAPTTTPGKIFTMVYVVVGIGFFVALVTEIAGHLIEARKRKDAHS
jgi:voltage-gated potassium channel